MTIHQGSEAFRLDRLLAAHERRDLLRFITCGSVDDGKSTLIGRLLYESKQLFDDQLGALERDSSRHGTQGQALDLALLVDGLAAEREQGITIDVAYRFFSTERRAFIVADTPGHEQYTRNMATGASTADLAILLVDATRGLIRQTRRHSLLVSMLGIRHVVVAVNKMDLAGWSPAVFERIMEDYRAFAAGLGFSEIAGIPISARDGDNVSTWSDKARWYDGPALLPYLEGVEVAHTSTERPFRLPVQWVNRPDPSFRGFAGLIAGGRVRPGDRVRVMPSGEETRVSRIVSYDGDLPEASEGRSVTLTLADEVDVSRGSVIVAADAPPQITDRLEGRVFWMAREPLREGATVLLKLGAQTVGATVARIRSRVDLETLTNAHARQLEVNDVGDVTLDLDRAVAWDAYAANRETGGFILIDRETFDTVAMGLAVAEKDHAFESAEVAPAVAAEIPSAEEVRASESVRRSLAKVVSWRLVGTAATVAVASAVTGDLWIGSSIGAAEIVVKLALSFAHERLWAQSVWR